MVFGLLGHPLSHSFSKTYFEAKFRQLGLSDHSYLNLEIHPLPDLHDLALRNTLSGFNITIPYKEQALSLLDAIDIAPVRRCRATVE